MVTSGSKQRTCMLLQTEMGHPEEPMQTTPSEKRPVCLGLKYIYEKSDLVAVVRRRTWIYNRSSKLRAMIEVVVTPPSLNPQVHVA